MFQKLWEYKVVGELDLLNVSDHFMSSGERKINELAKDGWEPFKILDWGGLGFTTKIMFRRRQK